MGEETRRWHHTQTHFVQTITPPIYSSKGPFIFPKNLYSPLRGLLSSPLSLLRWHLSLNSKPLLWVTYFSVLSLRYTWGIHVNNLFGSLLLICPLLLGSQPRTQKCRQKIIFYSLTPRTLVHGAGNQLAAHSGLLCSRRTCPVLSLCGKQSAFWKAYIEARLHILPLVFLLHCTKLYIFNNFILSKDLESCIPGHNT